MPREAIGHYQIERRLGRGGMGEVHLARDSRLGRRVAIKSLPAEFTADADRLARFEREARTLATLSHPNIALVYGLEEQDGARYLVLEYVEGETLADRLARGALPVDEALPVAAQIAAALEAAHEAGVIHRDVKPGNVMLTNDGTVKVLDFGLAKADEGGSATGSSLSQTPTMTTPAAPRGATDPGAILGTVAYMSPEQARGKRVDRRTDVWSLGVVLYESLTGDSPFTGETATDSIGAILHTRPDWSALPSETPRRMRMLLERMLEKDPKKRLRDAGDAMLELQAAADEAASGVIEPVPGHAGARRAPGLRLALAALTPAALAGFVGWRLGDSPDAMNPISGAAFTKITTVRGLEWEPALSPDGGTVVYTAEGPQDGDLFSLRVGGFNPINLTERFEGDDSQAAFSPDGQRLVFRSERGGGGLFVMGATGESPRRLTDFGYNPAWSPDGSRVVFATEGVTMPFARLAQSTLWTVDVRTGETTQLAEHDAVQPHWSPNGHRIAYWTTADGGERDIVTMPAGGGPPKPVTRDAATDWNPRWGPDGKHLYFCSDRRGVMNVWRVRIDEATGQVRGDPEPITAGAGGEVAHITIAADGRRIAFASTRMHQNVARIGFDLDQGRLTGEVEPVTQITATIGQFSVSPDGEWLAGTYLGEVEDLALFRTDGSERRRLTNDEHKDRGPAWSPDGSRVAFYSDRSGAYQIWTIDRDGGDLRRMTDGPAQAGQPCWSPDGRRLAYSALTDRGGRILTLSPEGEPLETASLPEYPDPAVTFMPTGWSPNGAALAGHATEAASGRRRAAVYWLDEERYDTFGVVTGAIRWVDGRTLLIGGQTGVELLDVASGETAPVRGDAVVEPGEMSLDRERRMLYFARGESESDIWLAELD